MPDGLYPSWPAAPGVMNFTTEYHRFWTPMAMNPQVRNNRFSHVFGAIGRLKSGVALADAQSSMDVIARALAEAYPLNNKGEGIALNPLADELVGNVRNGLIILQVSVGFVLLIACANVTSLAIARLSARRREIAVRTALGAARGRLVRQFLIEGMLLAFAGAVLGIAGATGTLRLLASLAPSDFPRMDQVHVGGVTILFTLIVSGLVCFLFATLPALQASKANPQEAINDSGRSMTTGTGRQRLRQLLVAGQMAIAVMLVIGSALLIESFRNLKNVDPGFSPVRLLTVNLSLPSSSYPNPARISGFADELLAKMNASSDIETSALAYDHPLEATWIDIFSIAKRPTAPGRDSPSGYFRIVSPTYFQTVGMTLVRGRTFNNFDTASAKGAAIISEAFAEQFFPGEDPIGEILDIRTPRAIWGQVVPANFEIVGIVKDTRFLGIDQAPAPAFYVPFAQCPSGQITTLVRTRREPDSLGPSFNMFLMTVFGLVALSLAAVGIYGLLAYLVSQRSQEISVRLALGASRGDVFGLIVGKGLALAVAGVLAGIVAALALTRTMEKLLFGVNARDPFMFAASAVFLVVVVFVACSIPALRATRVNPAGTLRIC
jgi:putative ABC transport system permease protein